MAGFWNPLGFSVRVEASSFTSDVSPTIVDLKVDVGRAVALLDARYGRMELRRLLLQHIRLGMRGLVGSVRSRNWIRLAYSIRSNQATHV